VIPQLLETIAFYLTAIILAVFGGGIASFAWAAIVRGLVGLVAIYYIQPWKIGFGIDRVTARRLLSFGIPFQTNSVLALVKDDLMTLFLGTVLPFSQVGYIGWAKKWAEAPLRLIMDNIIRVAFPAYARLQHDKIVLGKAIEKSFFFLALFIFPITFLLVIFIQPLIQIIPKYSKWESAVFSFYFFAFSSLVASFSSPLVNALNAIGKIKTTLVLMVVWTVMTWVLIPVFIYLFGFHGVAMAAFIISFTGIIPIVLVKKIVYLPVVKALYKPLIATFIALLPVAMIVFVDRSLPVLAFALIASLLVYGFTVWFWMKKEILPFIVK
jgi:O-antigen/teichoic acid export membrane protein